MRMKTSTLLLILGLLVVALVVSCVGVVALVVLYKGPSLPVAIEPAVGGVRTPPHTGIFIEREGTLVELDRVTRRFSDSSITPLPTFQVSDGRPLLVVYTPGESPSDLHMYKLVGKRPLEEVPINITPKDSGVVHVQPQQDLASDSYHVIHHGEGSPFQNTPAWGFAIGTPTELAEALTPTPPPWGPELVWETKTDSFLVADGVVYATYGTQVKALDLEIGQQLWLKDDWEVAGKISAVDQGLVYVQRNDSRIYALDTASGQEVWKFKVGPDQRVTDSVLVGATVCVRLSNSSSTVALDALTGEVKWTLDRYFQEVVEPYIVVTGIDVAENGRYLHYMAVLDPSSGQVIWETNFPSFYRSFFEGNLMFIILEMFSEGLQVFDIATGNLVATYNLSSVDGVIAYGNTVFVWGNEERKSSVVFGTTGIAIDITTGQEKYRWDIEALGEPVWADNGTAYLYEEHVNTLTAVDNGSGQILWQNDEIHQAERAPVVGNEEIIVIAGGSFYGLDPRTGENIWRTEHRSWMPNFVTFIQNYLLVVGGGVAGLLDPMTGETLWDNRESNKMDWSIEGAIEKDGLLLLYGSDHLGVFRMP